MHCINTLKEPFQYFSYLRLMMPVFFCDFEVHDFYHILHSGKHFFGSQQFFVVVGGGVGGVVFKLLTCSSVLQGNFCLSLFD